MTKAKRLSVDPASGAAAFVALDAQIRAGKLDTAREGLERLCAGKLPRESLRPAAALAWRAGAPQLGVKLLNPIVRSDRRHPVEATAQEKAEYAHCLTRIGAVDEAIGILDTLDAKAAPKVSFFLASAHMKRWDYEAALPLLRRYVEGPLPAYDRLVGRVNLAAVLVYLRRYRPASAQLRELVYETGVRKHGLLHANCLELAAYNGIMHGKYERARSFLLRAEALFERPDNHEAFFLRKWKAILSLRESGGSPAAAAEVEAVRREATARRHFETVRDCDRFLALVTGDEARFRHVYFGTPFESFRRDLQRDFRPAVQVPETYRWELGSGKKPAEIDVAAGRGPSGEWLKTGNAVHRLLLLFASDFYQPFRVPALFSRLFPNEYFDPASSPPRVHQTIKFLRQWLAAAGAHADVAVEDGFYRLVATGPCVLLLGAVPAAAPKEAIVVEKLRKHFSGREFSAKEAGDVLRTSARSALRVLQRAMEAGSVGRRGTRSAARYRFSR